MARISSDSFALDDRAAIFSEVVGGIRFTDGNGKPVEREPAMSALVQQLRKIRSAKGSVFVIGNGGSASAASHAVVDFVNVAGLRATTLHESSTLTCLANDYGYDAALARQIATFASPADLLIAISSSGQSANIRNAVSAGREAGLEVVTLSGFKTDNPLRRLGDINAWVDSDDYGIVELAHMFVLHNVADRLRLNL